MDYYPFFWFNASANSAAEIGSVSLKTFVTYLLLFDFCDNFDHSHDKFN